MSNSIHTVNLHMYVVSDIYKLYNLNT